MATSGLYIVTLLNEQPISVNAQDPRIAERCIKVTRLNCKVGKARSLEARARNYAKTFGQCNVVFRPIAITEDLGPAERSILRALCAWRVRGRRRRMTEWLVGIAPADAEACALDALTTSGIVFSLPQAALQEHAEPSRHSGANRIPESSTS